MKKLCLDVEKLEVQSFATAPLAETRGTVDAFGDSEPCSYDSPHYTMCELSCDFAC